MHYGLITFFFSVSFLFFSLIEHTHTVLGAGPSHSTCVRPDTLIYSAYFARPTDVRHNWGAWTRVSADLGMVEIYHGEDMAIKLRE